MMNRLRTRIAQPTFEDSSIHWQMLKEQVKNHTGLDPFSQVDDVTTPGFRYLNSNARSHRFQILEGDAPYAATTEWLAQAAHQLPQGAGPIEIDIAGFLLDRRMELGVLIGGMGSGKSTTLRQVAEWLKPQHIKVQYVNCDKIPFDPQSPPPAIALLVNALSALATNLVQIDEEIGPCWDWALAEYATAGDDKHSAVTVLRPAVNALQRRYGVDWRRSDHEALEYRRADLLATVCVATEQEFQYIAMRLDYHLTVACKNDRHGFCVVLDNIDPLPPSQQRDLLLAVSRFQTLANCKVMLAMRPLTYSLSNEQRGNRVVKVFQHLGPPALALIADRIKRLVEDIDMPALQLRGYVDGSEQRVLKQEDFKSAVRQLLNDATTARAAAGTRYPEPSASEFIEGLCNNSLRSALLVAEKLFGSPNLPIVLPDESVTSDGSHSQILKNHEIIRAVLLGRRNHFAADLTRVTDNIFDLGDATGTHSLTCKYRLLRELASAPDRGILPLETVVKRLRSFGIDDQTIVDSINAVIAQYKRLAWSDKVVAYESLSQPPNSKLCISRAGRFYVEQLVHSLEYAQEVHVDVLLPDEVIASSYNPRNVADRFDSVYRFIRHLHDVDRREVEHVVTDPASRAPYFHSYGATLFSTEIAKSLSRQIVKIGNAELRRRRGTDTHALDTTIARWSSIDSLLAREDQPIVDLLAPLKEHSHA